MKEAKSMEAKRVHWREEDEEELKSHAEGSNPLKRLKKEKRVKEEEPSKEDYEQAKRQLKRLVEEKNYAGIVGYFKDLVDSDKKLRRIREIFGRNSEKAREREKRVFSQYISVFDCFIFRKACAIGDIEMIKFLADKLTEDYLEKNISYRNFCNFDIYLTACDIKYVSEENPYKREDFIEIMKEVFLKVIDGIDGALEHYVTRIAGEYDARDAMREDFIIALHQAEQEGIIAPIDLEELEKIENSLKGKENIAKFSFVENLKVERAKALTPSKPEPSSPSFVQRILEERASNSPAKSPTP